jgi:hypothetical protein
MNMFISTLLAVRDQLRCAPVITYGEVSRMPQRFMNFAGVEG